MIKTIHTIKFVVKKEGSETLTTAKYNYRTPFFKECANKVLQDLKRKYTKENGYSITKHIAITETKEYSVGN